MQFLIVRPDLSLRENLKGVLQDLNETRIKGSGIIINAAELTKSYYYKNNYGYDESSSSKSKFIMRKLQHTANKTFSNNYSPT